MRLTVLAEKKGWHTDDLTRAAEEAGHSLRVQPWSSLSASVGTTQPKAFDDLCRSDAVLLRTMPAGTLEQVVFRMDLLHRLEAAGVLVINPPRAIETAVDKYLSLARIESAGLAVPPTVVCQRAVDAKQAFEQLGSDVIVKPIFGSEGFGMTRISDAALADRAFTQLERQGSAIYVQQFIPHNGSDVRLFVLNGNVIASMMRIGEDWRTNVARGGRAVRYEPDTNMCNMAIQAAKACGCALAGVDLLVGENGNRYILEANAVPGWKALASTTGIDVAAKVVAHIKSQITSLSSTESLTGSSESSI